VEEFTLLPIDHPELSKAVLDVARRARPGSSALATGDDSTACILSTQPAG
jgi:hypothetical protein